MNKKKMYLLYSEGEINRFYVVYPVYTDTGKQRAWIGVVTGNEYTYTPGKQKVLGLPEITNKRWQKIMSEEEINKEAGIVLNVS